jgi:hypothetical protein
VKDAFCCGGTPPAAARGAAAEKNSFGGIPAMRTLGRELLFAIWIAAASCALARAAEEEAVRYENGELTVSFVEVPLYLAVETIRFRTGLEIVFPGALGTTLLTFRVKQLPLEPAVRSLFSTIGVRSFAFVYDGEGRPSQAVVLASLPEERRSHERAADASGGGSELSAEEVETLLKQLERWGEIGPEERKRLEERLKTIPPSDLRDRFLKEYARQVLALRD